MSAGLKVVRAGLFDGRAAQVLRWSRRWRAGADLHRHGPARDAAGTARSGAAQRDAGHGAGQAEGLAFSVAEGQKLPPSLRNIFKEIQRDLGQPIPAHGSLRRWAEQGVLLLNTSLTVEEGQAASHAGWGWEALTAALLAEVLRTPGRVLMLWGAHAHKQVQGLDLTPHLVLQANHPSPLSATRGPVPFIGCGHFGRSLPHIRTLRPDFAW